MFILEDSIGHVSFVKNANLFSEPLSLIVGIRCGNRIIAQSRCLTACKGGTQSNDKLTVAAKEYTRAERPV